MTVFCFAEKNGEFIESNFDFRWSVKEQMMMMVSICGSKHCLHICLFLCKFQILKLIHVSCLWLCACDGLECRYTGKVSCLFCPGWHPGWWINSTSGGCTSLGTASTSSTCTFTSATPNQAKWACKSHNDNSTKTTEGGKPAERSSTSMYFVFWLKLPLCALFSNWSLH